MFISVISYTYDMTCLTTYLTVIFNSSFFNPLCSLPLYSCLASFLILTFYPLFFRPRCSFPLYSSQTTLLILIFNPCSSGHYARFLSIHVMPRTSIHLDSLFHSPLSLYSDLVPKPSPPHLTLVFFHLTFVFFSHPLCLFSFHSCYTQVSFSPLLPFPFSPFFSLFRCCVEAFPPHPTFSSSPSTFRATCHGGRVPSLSANECYLEHGTACSPPASSTCWG